MILTNAAISTLERREIIQQLAKRENWASKEAGVILVFCIVFIVGTGLIGLCISQYLARRKAAKAAQR